MIHIYIYTYIYSLTTYSYIILGVNFQKIILVSRYAHNHIDRDQYPLLIQTALSTDQEEPILMFCQHHHLPSKITSTISTTHVTFYIRCLAPALYNNISACIQTPSGGISLALLGTESFDIAATTHRAPGLVIDADPDSRCHQLDGIHCFTFHMLANFQICCHIK